MKLLKVKASGRFSSERVRSFNESDGFLNSNSATSRFWNEDAHYYELTSASLRNYSSDSKFIKLFNKLELDYKRFSSYYNSYTKEFIIDKFKIACSDLLKLDPDILGFEFTYDESLLFSFKKDDKTFHFERYLDESDSDEVIFSYYKGDVKQPGFAGRYADAICSIRKEVISKDIPFAISF